MCLCFQSWGVTSCSLLFDFLIFSLVCPCQFSSFVPVQIVRRNPIDVKKTSWGAAGSHPHYLLRWMLAVYIYISSIGSNEHLFRTSPSQSRTQCWTPTLPWPRSDAPRPRPAPRRPSRSRLRRRAWSRWSSRRSSLEIRRRGARPRGHGPPHEESIALFYIYIYIYIDTIYIYIYLYIAAMTSRQRCVFCCRLDLASRPVCSVLFHTHARTHARIGPRRGRDGLIKRYRPFNSERKCLTLRYQIWSSKKEIKYGPKR